MNTMRQAWIAAPDRLEIREAPRPALRGPGEILVRVLACGICSGDLMPWYLARKVGTVFGHEPIGRVEEIGADVSHLRPGDLVFVHHHAPCLECEACRAGAHVHCSTWKRSALDPGGMAEWIRVPAEIVRNDCFAVNDLHPEAGLFIEPLGCSVKAFRRAGGRPAIEGKRVAIIGCGIMGLLNLQTARAFGAREVIAIEPDPHRREWAVRLGAIPLSPQEAAERYRRAVDVAVIGPGFPEVIQQGLELIASAGVACLFTPTAQGVHTSLDLGDLYFRDVSLIPSYSCGPEDTREAARLLRTAAVDPRPLVTHRFPLEQAQLAMDTARRGGDVIKVIVTMNAESSP